MSQRAFQIISFIAQETGVYNEMHYRPYVPRCDDHSLYQLREATYGGTNLACEALSGVASQILRPSATAAGLAKITNGWNERRFRFIMRVKLVNRLNDYGHTECVISGYTDFTGASLTGNVDPNMNLYFNNVVDLQITSGFAHGIGDTIKMVGNSQVLNGGFNPVIMNGQVHMNDAIAMRPEDVFQQMRTDMYSGHGRQVVNDATTFSAGVKCSSRTNNDPSRYLSKVLNAHTLINEEADDYGRAVQRAQGMVREAVLSNNLMLFELQKETQIMRSGFVSWGELLSLNPHLNQIAQFNYLKPEAKAITNYLENSARLTGAAAETVAATMVANTVPGMMMDNMFISAAFAVNNKTFDGSVIVKQVGGQSIVQNMDMTGLIQRLENEMRIFVERDLTLNRQRTVDMVIQADAIGDTSVTIAFDGYAPVNYVLPSFCDAITAPVIGQGMQTLSELTSTIASIGANINVSGAHNGISSAV